MAELTMISAPTTSMSGLALVRSQMEKMCPWAAREILVDMIFAEGWLPSTEQTCQGLQNNARQEKARSGWQRLPPNIANGGLALARRAQISTFKFESSNLRTKPLRVSRLGL